MSKTFMLHFRVSDHQLQISDLCINKLFLLYDTIQVQSIAVPTRVYMAVPIYGIWHSNSLLS